MSIKIAPSLLAADFSRLGEEVRGIERAGADLLHLDIMDGHFVPNVSFGPALVARIRSKTRLSFEAHLMVTCPDILLEPFAQAGVQRIILHAEATPRLNRLLTEIRRLGMQTGLSLKPKTPLSRVLPYLPKLDLLLLMTVEPGFGGQAFMPEMLKKIQGARTWAQVHRPALEIEVDGGITLETAPQAVAAGATILVAGTALFGKPHPERIIRQLRSACPT